MVKEEIITCIDLPFYFDGHGVDLDYSEAVSLFCILNKINFIEGVCLISFLHPNIWGYCVCALPDIDKVMEGKLGAIYTKIEDLIGEYKKIAEHP